MAHRTIWSVTGAVLLLTLQASAAENLWTVQGGETYLTLDQATLRQAGVDVFLSDGRSLTRIDSVASLSIDQGSTLTLSASPQGILESINGGAIQHGQSLVIVSRDHTVSFDGFSIEPSVAGTESAFVIYSNAETSVQGRLDLRDTKIGFDQPGRQLMVEAAELTISKRLADLIGDSNLVGLTIGSAAILASIDPIGHEPGQLPSDEDEGGVAGGNNGTVCDQPGGPDVIVGDLIGIANYNSIAGIDAFAVGTTSCNVGNSNLSWVASTNQHPVIGQAIYRLKNNGFEQLGISWLKHGFTALTENICGCHGGPPPNNCPGPGGSVLGVGCSDPYSSGLNGTQSGLGPRFEVNPYTGFYPYPFTEGNQGSTGTSTYKRVQVNTSDLDTTSLFFCEGHYVTPDDATAGNQANNASYRRMTFSQTSGEWNGVNASGSTTQREQPAIRAWKDNDASVTETDVAIPSDGLVIVSSKATSLGGGFYRYEYAVQNLYSNRAIGSFTVPFPAGALISNVGFHDVSYHSGEPFDGTDWTPTIGTTTVSWATTPHATNPNANALRWGTLYNFRFDANVSSASGNVTLSLFKPGSPSTVTATAVIPAGAPPVCGNGSVSPGEECDPPDGIHCDSFCQWICGDGVTQSGEQCDDGNTVNNDACTNNCTTPACGDAIQQGTEECDDGNGNNFDACTNACNNAECGDSYAQSVIGEQCDDGNTVSGDGCSATCQSESNDACSAAVAATNGAYNFNTNGTTTDGPNPTCEFGADAANDVWYNYTATCTGSATFSTCNSANFDTVIVAYNNCSCPATNGNQRGCDDDTSGCNGTSLLSVTVTQGNCYKVRIGGFGPSDEGIGTLNISCAGTVCGNTVIESGEQCDDGNTISGDGCSSTCQTESTPPANNACATATAISAGSYSYSTVNATTDGPNEPTACNKFGYTNVGADIWYCYTAACNGTATVDLCNSTFDTKVAVYSGCTCPSGPSAIACNDDACGSPANRSSLSFSAVIGDSYLIRVGGYQAATGTGTMAVSCAPVGCQNAAACNDSNPCTNDSCNEGNCVNANNSNSCDDGDDCTTVDVCSGGQCTGGSPPNCPAGTSSCTDCNHNNIRDDCEGLADCDGNNFPDICETADCNNNGVADICDIVMGSAIDCDGGPVGSKTAGQTRFDSLCVFCHGAGGVGGVGPNLQDHTRVQIWNMLLPPTEHPGGAHPEYTQQDYADLEAYLAQAGSRGRPDRVPDSCQSLLNCNESGGTDGCELNAGTQVDAENLARHAASQLAG